ncbi:MAG TPA: histidinol dehydrogenase [Solirubrobacterales bacterium]|nr:histidinol dehydrogenase [Solirubrobacterales bacterium]
MKVTSFEWDGSAPGRLGAAIRKLQPELGATSDPVRGSIDAVSEDGDDALAELETRFGAGPGWREGFRQDHERIRSAADRLDPELLAALETAAANIRAVAEAQLEGDRELELDQGQRIGLREVPVGAAGIYAPGGAAAYPSTVLMGCIPARAAGVERVVLVTPPGAEEPLVPDVILAAARIAGADEVYATGGAQAIAALAIGTETIAPVDVVAGPGNRYVQEAKRQLVGKVGIDGIAGPSELMAIAGDTADPGWIALDLCAQAEHGPDGLLVAAAVETVILDAIRAAVEELASERRIAEDAPLALVAVPDTSAAVALSNALAPEHLEILTEDAVALSTGVRTAGCVFVGEGSATAFGDYAAGSSHVLPTGGAGRFQGPLSPSVFRRRISTVEITHDAARSLAPTVATLARAEGFPLHADSVEARVDGS